MSVQKHSTPHYGGSARFTLPAGCIATHCCIGPSTHICSRKLLAEPTAPAPVENILFFRLVNNPMTLNPSTPTESRGQVGRGRDREQEKKEVPQIVCCFRSCRLSRPGGGRDWAHTATHRGRSARQSLNACSGHIKGYAIN